MDGAFWGFIGVIIGGIITGLTTLGVENVKAGKESALDSAKRRDDRQLGLDQFQRETLLAVQEAVIELGRASARVFKHDAAQVIAGHAWRIDVDEELLVVERAARLRVIALKTRIADDETRALADAVVAATLDLSVAKDAAAGADLNATVSRSAVQTIERSGVLIRATFRASAQ